MNKFLKRYKLLSKNPFYLRLQTNGFSLHFIWLIILLITVDTVWAQDIHYSMPELAPLNLAPSNAGNFEGKYRFHANHRNQWKSVTTPFKTFSLGCDAANIKSTKLGAGFILNQDVTGDSKFKTTQFNVLISYKAINKPDSSQFLTFGIASGFTARSLDYSALQFDAQYNGLIFNPNHSNNEIFDRNQTKFLDLHCGMSYFNRFSKKINAQLGLGIYNLTRPNTGLFADQIRLDVRYIFNLQINYIHTPSLLINPLVFIQLQGKMKELLMGVLMEKILFNELGVYRSLWSKLLMRQKDAFMISAGLKFNDWNFGINYDINFSKLVPASRYRGALELGVIKIIRPQFKLPVHRICPDYL